MDGLNLISGIIGVKFAKNCHPDDLWVKYFTSSKFVKAFREKHGEPDVIEVRKTFDTKEKAIEWEFCVIRRLKAIKDIKFLNCGIQGKFFCTKNLLSEDHKQKIQQSWTDERKQKSSENWKENNPMFDEDIKKIVGSCTTKRLKGKALTEEHKKHISESMKGKTLTEEHIQVLTNRTGKNNPMFGKKISREIVEKRIEKMRPKVSGENHWMFGKTYSDEYKSKMSESLKASWAIRKANKLLEL